MSELRLLDNEEVFNIDSKKWDFYVFDKDGDCLTVGVMDDLDDDMLFSKLKASLNKVYEQKFYERYE